MYQRKPTRRFRRRPDNRSGLSHVNGSLTQSLTQIRPHSFSNGQARNKFRPTLSAERQFEKYNDLETLVSNRYVVDQEEEPEEKEADPQE